ncbi:MAG: hypothetical protein KF745_13605 [Phycisphaeraceae bacterium]|nr:hypothetical protein [Phycisphaeraceae bacterium]
MNKINSFAVELDIVLNDLIQLQSDHELWCGLNSNLLVNPHAGEPGEAMEFITRSHFIAFGMGLRRQVDRDSRSICLASLISRVARRDVIFRRSDYVQRYVAAYPEHAAEWEALGDEDFSRLAADCTAQIYPPVRALRHLEWLNERAEPLRNHINSRVAHRSRRDSGRPHIRYHQRLLWAMQQIWEHYCMLSTGAAHHFETGLLGDDWRRAFERAWMPRPVAPTDRALPNTGCTD